MYIPVKCLGQTIYIELNEIACPQGNNFIDNWKTELSVKKYSGENCVIQLTSCPSREIPTALIQITKYM